MGEHRRNDWNPLDPSVLKDQQQAYDRMRERCPLAHSDFMGWSLFRHADITAVLAATGIFSNAAPFPAIPNGMDPPEHGLYRAALDTHFSAATLQRQVPLLRAIAVALLEPQIAAGNSEFIEAFTYPFTMRSQCALLGWPEAQWPDLRDWTKGNAAAALHQDQEAGKMLAETFSELVIANLERQRAAGQNASNATTVLLRTRVEDKPLSDAQIVTVLRNWIAGQGTAAAGLGILVMHLAQSAQLQQLRLDTSLIPAAVEEILRADGPLVANRRTLTTPTTLAGQALAAGEKLSLMWMAANRDPGIFENPGTIMLGRNTEQSLVWGQGIHLCQGAPLARLELCIALEELLARTTLVELDGTLPPRSVYPGNGLTRLPLRFRT